jgi:hypothetical protein
MGRYSEGGPPTTPHVSRSVQAHKLASMRQFVAVDIMINPIYSYTRAARELVSIRSGISHAKRASREKRAAAPNKRRKNEKDKSRLSSWGREARGSTGKRREVSTGTYPGDAAATPRVLDIGPEIHRDRISGSSKSSQQRSSSRVCLELITTAREQRANHPHRKGSVQACKRTSTRAQANKRG